MLRIHQIILLFVSAKAFTVQKTRPAPQKTGRIFGIAEWRDTDFDLPGTERPMGSNLGPPPKQVCILPFPNEEVLLQGETKQLRLYEDRFIKLFDDAMNNCSGVVAMGLLADSGIIQTVPLCEIEAYNRMEEFGIFVTIRAVGRARLLDITKQAPYLKAVCTEIIDTVPPNLELPNLLASNIENFMLTLSSMEFQLNQARTDEDELDEDDLEMQRRITIARLEDRFYVDDDEEDESDDEEDRNPDRRGRFRMAYHVAMEADTQGYTVPSKEFDRGAKELTAISWASFCSELLAEDDAIYRIQALDCDDLFERLKLASYMLRMKKEALQEKMKKAGLKYRGDDFDEIM